MEDTLSILEPTEPNDEQGRLLRDRVEIFMGLLGGVLSGLGEEKHQRMKSSFSERVKIEREPAGLSETQLARMSDLSGPHDFLPRAWQEHGQRECGRQFPTGNNLVKFAEALRIDPVEVMKVDGKSATAGNEAWLLAAPSAARKTAVDSYQAG